MTLRKTTLAAAIALLSATAHADCSHHTDIREMQVCINIENAFAQVFADNEGKLRIIEKVGRINGDFEEYVDGDPEKLRSPLLAKALENEGLRLRAKPSRPNLERSTYDIELEALDDKTSPISGALIASTYGPDISGRDLVTSYNKIRLGGGYVATASVTHGFSDLRPESKDGQFNSIFLDLEKAFTFGLINLSHSYTDNKAGGDSLIYVLGGKTHRSAIALTNWAGPFKFGQSVEHTRREQEMGSFDLSTEQRYTSAIAWIGYEAPGIAITARGKKGVAGDQDYDLIPLLGDFNAYYSSIDIEGRARVQLADRWLVVGRVEGFTGSQDMPSSERIGLGGMGAGSSHESGLYSGYKGVQHDLSINYLALQNGQLKTTLRAGVNGAQVTTAMDEKIRLSSAEVGVELNFKRWTASVIQAETIGASNVDYDRRMNAQIVWKY